jgi:hypothetical protein
LGGAVEEEGQGDVNALGMAYSSCKMKAGRKKREKRGGKRGERLYRDPKRRN